MTNETNDSPAAIRKLIEAGIDVTGSVGGAAIGTIIAGPPGAIAGSAAGPLLTHALRTATEFTRRQLGRREEVRVGATLAFAINKINENRENSQQLRQDNFFHTSLTERSTADEIIEGVLLVAQREYQEKKLRFYGNLIANIAFDSEVSRDLANLLIRVADNLLYRQLVLLSFFHTHENSIANPSYSYTADTENDLETNSVVEDVYDLMNQGMLVKSSAADLYFLATIGRIRVARLGNKLYELMSLHEIERDDLRYIESIVRARDSSETDYGDK